MPVVKFFPFFVLAIGLLESKKKRKRDIPKKEKEEQQEQESIAQIHEVKERCVA